MTVSNAAVWVNEWFTDGFPNGVANNFSAEGYSISSTGKGTLSDLPLETCWKDKGFICCVLCFCAEVALRLMMLILWNANATAWV